MARSSLLTLIVLAAAIARAPAQAPAPGSAGVEARVEAILRQMTLEEKIDLLGGVDAFDVRGAPRLGVPRLGTADGPFGVRAGVRSNAMAGGIALAATWDPALARRVGTELGRDARARGKHFHLAPGVNIYRAPLNGRNFEYFGEDPFLAARMAVGYIQGVQSQGVSSTIKHFLGNNSEFARKTSDSVIDERALREIYLPAFEAAVREARVGAIMGAYNMVNGEHMSQNRRLNVDLVKGEWGFPGVMMSDWGATHDTLGAANGGLDLEMPAGDHLNRAALLPLLQQGKVAPAALDDKARRILRTAARFGWLDRPQLDSSIPPYNPRGREAALQTARQAMVLLKNDRSLLPLGRKGLRSVAVIGPNAYPSVPLGGGSATVVPFRAVSFFEGVSRALGTSASVHTARGIPSLARVANTTRFTTAAGGQPGVTVETFENPDLAGRPSSVRVEPRIRVGAPLVIGTLPGEADEVDPPLLADMRPRSFRWTGYYTPEAAGECDFIVQQGGFAEGGYRLFADGRRLADRWRFSTAAVDPTRAALDASPHRIVLELRYTGGFGGPYLRLGIMPRDRWVDPEALKLAAAADAVVLAAGFDPESEAEGWDRTFQLPPGQDDLVRKVAAANPRTVVVLTSGGAVEMTGWLDRVPAVVEAWYPGQEGGTALAEILLGDVNPSGRLPTTFERRWEDNPVHDSYYPEPGTNRITYKEGVFVGYRGYERGQVRPLFPFGFGLSYTTFRYRNLALRTPRPVAGAAPQVDVSFDVTNTGSRGGAEVAQVYVADRHAPVPRPPKELKGFARVELRPGETRRVTVTLDERAFAYYDVTGKAWRTAPGEFEILVGRSSAGIELRGNVSRR